VSEPIDRIATLREKIDEINLQILELLCQRGEIVQEIGHIHAAREDQFFHPERELEMLTRLVAHNRGPYSDEIICYLFKEIFKASLHLEERQHIQHLLSHRSRKAETEPVQDQDLLGRPGDFSIIAGPCSIESMEQLVSVAETLVRYGIRLIRGGAYKPRTSPYSFQGLGEIGLRYLSKVAQRFGLITISEIMDIRDVELFYRHVDILQVGARNMHNFPLLRAVGETGKPVLLKRSMMSTIKEFLLAAEYVLLQGGQVILCERGIRTFEPWTRSTLDLAGVAVLKQETYLPIIVDISHSAGRRDIAIPLARAAWAVGADGIMVEVHPNPALAHSDNKQQLNFEQFKQLLDAIRSLGVVFPMNPLPPTKSGDL
jgi:3-deoxy-7-phosphoheptulonate synthase/chorismate mutase